MARKPARHPGQLLGLSEIADRLHTTRQRANELSRTDAFPAPQAELRMGPVWLAADIDRWARRHRPERSL